MPPRRSTRTKPAQNASPRSSPPVPASSPPPPAAHHDVEQDDDSAEDDSDDDNDAPVAVTLAQAKRAAQTQQRRKEEARAEVNRARREKAKAKAKRPASASREGKGKPGLELAADGDDEDEDDDLEVADEGVESRMERAMREAAEESGDEDEDEDGAGSSGVEDNDVDMGVGSGSDDEDASLGEREDDEDEDMGDMGDTDASSQDDEEPVSASAKHLPDHLFASAFASTSTSNAQLSRPSPASGSRTTTTTKKRKLSKKELVVNSRTIRIQSTLTPKIPSTLPSRKVRKFTEKALALSTKSTASSPATARQKKQWERVPAAIGVLRRHSLSDDGEVPRLREIVSVFVRSAQETWIWFFSEFALIDGLQASKCDNEGALGEHRAKRRLKERMTVTVALVTALNGHSMHGRNETPAGGLWTCMRVVVASSNILGEYKAGVGRRGTERNASAMRGAQMKAQIDKLLTIWGKKLKLPPKSLRVESSAEEGYQGPFEDVRGAGRMVSGLEKAATELNWHEARRGKTCEEMCY
ncbi:hypothetical protein HMN09_01096700 [Mycena chlorophos]|uniref:Uncharacterized protein n=1 Tax=Mycena chlorophos TaxID=658473 RepID=A0A8H6W1V3_MYCCL|nr:hypothetical protein HMN09_01096700 [Mycena chlorophos]